MKEDTKNRLFLDFKVLASAGAVILLALMTGVMSHFYYEQQNAREEQQDIDRRVVRLEEKMLNVGEVLQRIELEIQGLRTDIRTVLIRQGPRDEDK